MKTHSILTFLFSLFLIHSSYASSEAQLYVGKAAIPETSLSSPHILVEINRDSYQKISRILEAESQMATVSDALALKRSGLVYAENIDEFAYLCSILIQNPSEAYLDAVSEFIASYIASYVKKYSDLPTVRHLESRTRYVNQAQMVKRAGMKAVRNLYDFIELVKLANANPSEAYKTMVSNFVAQNISSVIDVNSPIYMIVNAERHTLYVNDAMAVKRAGLVAVHSKSDLIELARFSVDHPSEAYRAEVGAFIRNNISNYP